jgi:hypothetical protein
MSISTSSSTARSYLAPSDSKKLSRQQRRYSFFSASTDIFEAETSTFITSFEQYDFDEDIAKLIKKLSSKYQFAVNITDANEEVKLCLRKCDNVDWKETTNYLSSIIVGSLSSGSPKKSGSLLVGQSKCITKAKCIIENQQNHLIFNPQKSITSNKNKLVRSNACKWS